MIKKPFTIQDFMYNLKPVRTCDFMDMCWNYYRDCEQAMKNGETHYEISGLNTKSGQPYTIQFYS